MGLKVTQVVHLDEVEVVLPLDKICPRGVSVTTSLRSLTVGYTLPHTEARKGSGRLA